MTDMPGATITGLPTQNNINLSITAQSPTILLDAESGELVPHFAELDVSATSSENNRALLIRPVVRLKDKTRYIVAIRHVVDAKNQALPPSPAFQALRDGTASDEASVGARRDLYADIFAKLQKAGIAKDDLQLAWDYTTSSRENNTRWLVHMRDDALATLGTDGPPYVIDSVEMDPNPSIHMRIHGHMTVPLYLDKPGPGGRLVFGPDGLPKQNGTADYDFLVQVPNSAMTAAEGFAVVQNGHGLLGAKTEGQNGYLATICEKNHFISIAVDLVGMAEEDYDSVLAAIGGDIGGFEQLVERQHQGILNSLLAMRMMKNTFWKDPQLQVNGHSVINPTHLYYRGDSQGGIFGTTYMALTTDVTRGLLGEPGMPYNLLLNRSADFAPFFDALQIVYQGGRSIQQVLGLVQMLWDRTEPNGYAPYIVENTLPNTPSHQNPDPRRHRRSPGDAARGPHHRARRQGEEPQAGEPQHLRPARGRRALHRLGLRGVQLRPADLAGDQHPARGRDVPRQRQSPRQGPRPRRGAKPDRAIPAHRHDRRSLQRALRSGVR
ncbi:MAG: hypothetical protein QM820_37850 [Minicystis sp.]